MRGMPDSAFTGLLAVPAAAGDADGQRRDPASERRRISPALCRDLDREQARPEFVGNLAVWYDLKQKDNEGTKWLKDMRQWWRAAGPELTHAGRRLEQSRPARPASSQDRRRGATSR